MSDACEHKQTVARPHNQQTVFMCTLIDKHWFTKRKKEARGLQNLTHGNICTTQIHIFDMSDLLISLPFQDTSITRINFSQVKFTSGHLSSLINNWL